MKPTGNTTGGGGNIVPAFFHADVRSALDIATSCPIVALSLAVVGSILTSRQILRTWPDSHLLRSGQSRAAGSMIGALGNKIELVMNCLGETDAGD